MRFCRDNMWKCFGKIKSNQSLKLYIPALRRAVLCQKKKKEERFSCYLRKTEISVECSSVVSINSLSIPKKPSIKCWLAKTPIITELSSSVLS